MSFEGAFDVKIRKKLISFQRLLFRENIHNTSDTYLHRNPFFVQVKIINMNRKTAIAYPEIEN